MAALKDVEAYQQYLKGVAEGTIVLPMFSTLGTEVHIEYGELYCRIPNCNRRKNPFSATNNLRQHVQGHKNAGGEYYTAPSQKGGRVSQEVIDEAIKFYVTLAEQLEILESESESGSESEGEVDEGVAKVKLPLRQDGKTPAVKKMQEIAREEGKEVPCDGCKEAGIACCKDSAVCTIFDLFDCEF
ncbi:hypothetical protein FQN52_001822 [Onygenales sp. PD_12]|nr:hypothetical protein FQN52_001822 [Onygenales sp. PD_12]